VVRLRLCPAWGLPTNARYQPLLDYRNSFLLYQSELQVFIWYGPEGGCHHHGHTLATYTSIDIPGCSGDR
jgi:hypothetical protein